MSNTRLLCKRARPADKEMEVVVLPVPPFWEAMEMMVVLFKGITRESLIKGCFATKLNQN